MKINLMKNISKGFTLIELLIVIAVLGVLAAVILVAIDPAEQLARGRDAGRKSSVTQLGRALQAYYTVNSATGYPNPVGPPIWTITLQNSGEIRIIPATTFPPSMTVTCTAAPSYTVNLAGGFCYKSTISPPGIANIVVYTRMESKSESSKNPPTSTCPAADIRWYMYGTSDGRGGTVCSSSTSTGEPDPITAYGTSLF